MKNCLKGMLFSFLLIAFSLVISSWGFLSHTTAHQLAVYMLPKDMSSFFYANMEYITYNAVRPDVRRNKDKKEEPRHYIDFEAYGDSAAYTMPWKWDNAIKKFSKDTLLRYGYLPYRIIEMQSRLTNAFKKRNTDSILFYAADLGHYIEDACAPLHTTINYDGQLSNQKGLHALWETTIPEIEIKNYTLTSKHEARYIKNKEQAVWAALRRSHTLLTNIFRNEIEVSKQFTDAGKYRIQIRNGKKVKSYTIAFARAYNKALGNTINDQLIYSANMLADFWFTAWIDAGKPDLSKLLKAGLSAEQKEQLKKELISFKNNHLVDDGYLRARWKKK